MTAAKKGVRKVVPVRELISVQADRLGLKNPELAERLGYPAANVVSMIKSGSMRLPINKIAITAEVLQIDPLYLAQCVDAESDFQLGPFLDAISKRTPITLNEEKLIAQLRKIADGVDVDLDDHPQELATIKSAFSAAAHRDRIDFEKDTERLKGKRRSALANAEVREEKLRKAA